MSPQRNACLIFQIDLDQIRNSAIIFLNCLDGYEMETFKKILILSSFSMFDPKYKAYLQI